MSEIVSRQFQKAEINTICLEIGGASVTLSENENDTEIEVSLKKGEERFFRAKTEGNILKVSYVRKGKVFLEEHHEIAVKIPKAARLERMEISAGAGNVKIEVPQLVCREMYLECGAAKMKVQDMETEDKLYVEVGAGQVNFERMRVKDVSMECGAGKIKAEFFGNENDYNYEVSCAIGKIEINGKTTGKFLDERKIINPGADRTIKMECGVGKIEVNMVQ